MALRIGRFLFLFVILLIVGAVLYTSSSPSSFSSFKSAVKPSTENLEAASEKDYEAHRPAGVKSNLHNNNPELERFPIGSAVIKAVDAAIQTPPTKEQLRSLIEGGPVAAATAVSSKVKAGSKSKSGKGKGDDEELESEDEEELVLPPKGRGRVRPNEAKLREGMERAAAGRGKTVTGKKAAAVPKGKVAGMK